MGIRLNGLKKTYQLQPANLKGLFGWRSGKVREYKIMRGWKSVKIEKILISLFFFFFSLGVEKWRDRKSEFI